jgi:hypothetical protein
MTCNYKIVLVLDGGRDSLLVPIIGLNHLSKRVDPDALEKSLFNWLDLIVASGDSVLLASILAQKNSDVLSKTLKLEDFIHYQNQGAESDFANYFFHADVKLRDLKTHYNFLSYDIDTDEVFQFSDIIPTQQGMSVHSMLKACMSNPAKNQFVKLGFRHLISASEFVPNPILQASHFTRCLYQENPIVIVSIGSGLHEENDLEQEFSKNVEELFKKELTTKRNWHYFRFNPTFEACDSIVMKINKTYRYFEDQAQQIDRLIRLMDIRKNGVIT